MAYLAGVCRVLLLTVCGYNLDYKVIPIEFAMGDQTSFLFSPVGTAQLTNKQDYLMCLDIIKRYMKVCLTISLATYCISFWFLSLIFSFPFLMCKS